MKCAPIPRLILALGLTMRQAYSQTGVTKSPKEVVEQFLRVETEGGRLTPEGWRKADVFFDRPSQSTSAAGVFLIYKDFGVLDPTIKGNVAEVTMDIYDQGRIDSALRYIPPQTHSYKSGIMFKLVLTNKRWESGAPGQSPKEVTGPLEWRIQNNSSMLILNANSAIRYVTEMRNKTTDPAMKKNADQTLAKLRTFR